MEISGTKYRAMSGTIRALFKIVVSAVEGSLARQI